MLRRSNLLSNDAEEAYIKAKLGFVYIKIFEFWRLDSLSLKFLTNYRNKR